MSLQHWVRSTPCAPRPHLRRAVCLFVPSSAVFPADPCEWHPAASMPTGRPTRPSDALLSWRLRVRLTEPRVRASFVCPRTSPTDRRRVPFHLERCLRVAAGWQPGDAR